MAEIEKFSSDKRLKSLDEFDQKPIYTMGDTSRPTKLARGCRYIGLVAG